MENDGFHTSTYTHAKPHGPFNQWRTSTYSYDIGACVEVRNNYAAALVRDTQNRDAGHLVFNRREWAGLLAAIQ